MSSGLDSWPHRIRPARGEAEGALVLFHGRATDELDLVQLVEELDPERRLVGITPRGPLSFPPGGAHWYAVRRIGYPDPETFFKTFEPLSNWVDGLPEALGVPADRVVLGGFSQGTVMAYALALARGRPSPAGVLALSGFIPTVDGLELDLGVRRGLPVAIGHGVYDPVISVEFARDARARLEEAGAQVLYRESPMPHTIDPAFLPELQDWLRTKALAVDDR